MLSLLYYCFNKKNIPVWYSTSNEKPKVQFKINNNFIPMDRGKGMAFNTIKEYFTPVWLGLRYILSDAALY